MKKYNKQNIPFARELRNNMTPWERKLWYEFLSYYPVRFQRQKAIGNYIVDFYCAKARLAIELDGGGHCEPEQAQADARRTAELENMGLSVIRVCNLDIDRNFRGVCEYINQIVQDSLPQSASLTAPSSEGALARPSKRKCIYALGFFDGVHLGHQALLDACKTLATQENCAAGVITFDAHPDTLVLGKTPALINTAADRQLLLENAGMDSILSLPFDKAMMEMPWQHFFRMLLDTHHAAGLVCGSDFRFGHRGEGNAQLLRSACEAEGIPCAVMPEQTVDGIRVSSTHIRALLEQGQIETAVRFLGHPHILTGTVISGRKLGRTIGVPTANLAIPEGLLIPRLGVYACLAVIDGKKHMAVTNIGNRPTVEGHHITVEPWILDFDGDLYGQTITLEFHKFLRPEQKFPDLATLQAEIRKNGEETRNFFGKM